MIYKIFMAAYVLVILMPTLRVLDIISSQGLFLNILNCCSSLFLLYNVFIRRKFFSDNKHSGNNFIFISFFLFFLWSSITTSWALNKSEAYRALTEIFTTLLAFINIYYHSKFIKSNRIHFIFLILLLMHILEVSFLTFDYLSDILAGIYTPGSMRYIGLTGNKNIASFSLLVKFPVLIYFINNKSTYSYKFLLKWISLLLVFITSYLIFFVTLTRAAQLALILLILFYLLNLIIKSIQNSNFIFKNQIRSIFFIFPIIISLLIGQLFSKNTISINENITTAFVNTDSSSNERIRFYKYAIEIIKDNFFTGTGIGSWELESIEKDRLEMKSYIVPYHVHNDFLEIFSETGFFGFIFLYAPILMFFFFLFRLIFINRAKKNRLEVLVVFLMLAMYTADALLNFPFARVIQNINLIFSLTLCLHLFDDEKLSLFKKNWTKHLNYIFLFLLVISPISVYSSIRQFKSSVDQSMLLFAFNQNNFKLFKEEDLKKVERVYPNLTMTGLPISTIIGLHYYYYKDYESAEKFFREGVKANPYLNVNQSYLGLVYEKKGELDSAKFYTKYAFDKMPNNPVHFAHYVQVLMKEYDTLSIKKAYDKITYKERDPRFNKLYLLAMSNLLDKDEGKMVLNDIKKNQLKEDGLKASYYILELGRKRVIEGYINYTMAESYFNNNDFTSAAKFYDLAFENNPLEYPYLENAAISYLKIGKLEEALERINEVIENLSTETKNGKAFYIKGLVYLEKDDRKKACEEFEKALRNGFNTKMVLSSYCR